MVYSGYYIIATRRGNAQIRQEKIVYYNQKPMVFLNKGGKLPLIFIGLTKFGKD